MDFLVNASFSIKRLVQDSRRIQPGDTFVACQGEHVDGRRFIPDALARGAASVIWDSEGFAWKSEWTVPHLAIPNLRWRLGDVAAEFYAHPTSGQWVCGVTGTNGKTSCTQWLAQILDSAQKRCAVVGTVGNGFIEQLEATTHTTPDALTMQELLHKYRQAGATHVAMEVSSHGLHQGRVNGVEFDVAVLTNLTRDHLDYHGSMEEYAAAKARLFGWTGLQAAVLNADDPFTATLLNDKIVNAPRVLTYGFDAGADVRATRLQLGAHGFELDLATPWGDLHLSTALLGRFNASNLMAVATAALLAGVTPRQLEHVAPAIMPAPGRMQTLGGRALPLVVVDYAHTPDALEKVLTALREMLQTGQRLIAVFGCGGDRDPGKRPLMGSAVSRLADIAVVTSDNPRSEDPFAIIEQIESGMQGDYRVEADRKQAIRLALDLAQAGDIVLIAGKGHEAYQEIAGVKHSFSDVDVAAEALAS